MAPRIRPYDPADFSALCRMDAQCYAPEVAYSRRTMRAFLRLPGAECLVAEEDGVIHGFILTDRDVPAGHVITLDVAPDARRRGIGTALLEAAHGSLAAHGVREVDLETSTTNAAAVAFWQHHDYRACGVLPNYYENGEDAYWMTKSLERAAAQSGM
jgi:ribosomal-protein-alanine N-acetyltransferase